MITGLGSPPHPILPEPHFIFFGWRMEIGEWKRQNKNKILCATRKPHQPFSAMAPRPPRHWRHSLVSYPRFATIRLWPFACNQSHPSHMLRVGYWSLDTSVVLLSCILKMLGLLFEILGLEMVPFSVHFGSLGHPWAR